MKKRNKKLGKYRSDPEQLNLWAVEEEHKVTFLDGSFQRWAGTEFDSGWSKENTHKYLASLFAEDVSNDMIRVDVKEALGYCEQQDLTPDIQKSRQYYANLLSEGYEYVSIDGNNTSSAISAFMRGDISAEIDERGAKVNYKELSSKAQLGIGTRCASVITLTNITCGQMHNLFRRLNMGTHLNPQEYRQAVPSALSKFIREISNSNSLPTELLRNMPTKACYPTGNPFYDNLVYGKQSDRDCRRHEQLTAQLALKLHSNFGAELSKVGLDKFYETVDALGTDVEKVLNDIFDVVNRIAGVVGDSKLSKYQATNFLDFIHILCIEQKYKILKPIGIFDAFENFDAAQVAKSSELTELERENSYNYLSSYSGRSEYYLKIREMIREDLIKANIKEWVESGIVAAPLSTPRRFSLKQKIILREKQNKVTRSGKDITVRGIKSGEFEGDHMVSHADGGTTTIANGEIMTQKENRSKGSDSWEPYFNHQFEEKDED